jgi:para-aminobenzoate synthetase component I
MQPLIQEIPGAPPMDEVARRWNHLPGFVYLRTGTFDHPGSRFSIIAAEPFLTISSTGTFCRISPRCKDGCSVTENPWRLLERLFAECELESQDPLPFPAGGVFGYWGYDLKNIVEPKLGARVLPDPRLPDCWAGFYGSLLVWDHNAKRASIVATGLEPEGSRSLPRVQEEIDAWRARLDAAATCRTGELTATIPANCRLSSTPAQPCMSREQFLSMVIRAQQYIRAGDIYQVNLSRSWLASCDSSWELFERLACRSPAPFSAFIRCEAIEIVSSSPEQFLRFDNRKVQTRPIKGTRPRHEDPEVDARFAAELRDSPKENAELLMITDLLRNDLGKVCEFGSVVVPQLSALERYSHVQHLVSTVQGSLRPGLSHLAATEACFPGGSITGAPKFRAMQIIDELEPVPRGPYTGALGCFGFNRQSMLNILIRTVLCRDQTASFHAGAGIVADSDPAAEYEETRIKAQGIIESLVES